MSLPFTPHAIFIIYAKIAFISLTCVHFAHRQNTALTLTHSSLCIFLASFHNLTSPFIQSNATKNQAKQDIYKSFFKLFQFIILFKQHIALSACQFHPFPAKFQGREININYLSLLNRADTIPVTVSTESSI